MKSTLTSILIALAIPAGICFAQTSGGTTQGIALQSSRSCRPPGPPPPPPDFLLLITLDTDGDGILSAEEIANASEQLKKLDKDGDGALSREEYMPPPPCPPPSAGSVSLQQKGNASGASAGGESGAGGPPPPLAGTQHEPPPSPLLQALDADGDGIISAEEIAAAPQALKALDKNNDGQLGPWEYWPKPQWMSAPPADAPASGSGTGENQTSNQ